MNEIQFIIILMGMLFIMWYLNQINNNTKPKS